MGDIDPRDLNDEISFDAKDARTDLNYNDES